jgi:hypothetical protein
MALIAISSGKFGGIDPPSQDEDAGIQPALPGEVTARTVSRLMLGSEILIGPECVEVDAGSVPRHRGELLPRDEPAAAWQRDHADSPQP